MNRDPLAPNTHRNRDNWPEAEESGSTFWGVFWWLLAGCIAAGLLVLGLVK
jgi:hypothetical protein